MGALSNLYFNNIGYNGTGYVGDNFASTMNMMFNGVNGVSIFGCGYPGFGDLGGGFCPNNNTYWGMLAGVAGFNIFTNIVTARIGNHRAAKAEAKAQDAKDNQSFNTALETLGFGEEDNIETITDEGINSKSNEAKKEENLIKSNTTVSAAKTALDEAKSAFDKVKKEVDDNLGNAITKHNNAEKDYKTALEKLNDLNTKRTNGESITADQISGAEALVKSAKEAMDEAEKEKKDLEDKKTSIEEGGTLYKAKAKADKTYQDALETARADIDKAAKTAKEYLPKAQAKAKEAREVREKQEAKEAKKAERAQRREDRRAERKEKRNNFLLDIADGNDKKIDEKLLSSNDVDNLQSAIYSFKTAKTDADKNTAASICKNYIDIINTRDLKANERIQYNIAKRAYDAIIKPWLEDYEKNNPDM